MQFYQHVRINDGKNHRFIELYGLPFLCKSYGTTASRKDEEDWDAPSLLCGLLCYLSCCCQENRNEVFSREKSSKCAETTGIFRVQNAQEVTKSSLLADYKDAA